MIAQEMLLDQVRDALRAAGITWTEDDEGYVAVHGVLGCSVAVGPDGVEVWEVERVADPDRVALVLEVVTQPGNPDLTPMTGDYFGPVLSS